jgi:hypothetical protein
MLMKQNNGFLQVRHVSGFLRSLIIVERDYAQP